MRSKAPALFVLNEVWEAVTFSLANLLGGLMAAFSTKFKPGPEGEAPQASFILEGLPGFYLMLVVFPLGAGIVIFALTPILKRMMHGVK